MPEKFLFVIKLSSETHCYSCVANNCIEAFVNLFSYVTGFVSPETFEKTITRKSPEEAASYFEQMTGYKIVFVGTMDESNTIIDNVKTIKAIRTFVLR